MSSVYDFYPPAELAISKIREIHRCILEADIALHGFPPQTSGHEDIYVRTHSAILDKALRIAQKTQIKLNGKSRLAEDSSMTEDTSMEGSASVATNYRSQSTLLPSETSKEVGTVMPSNSMITHPQPPTIQQYPILESQQTFFPESQLATRISNSTTDMTGMFDQDMYQGDSMEQLSQGFTFNQNDGGAGFYDGQFLMDQPDLRENTENWLPPDHRQ